MLELAATDDQETIEALPTHAGDPAFRVRTRVRRAIGVQMTAMSSLSGRCVEGAAELRVPIVDQEARPLAAVAEIHHQVACLRGPSTPRWGCSTGRVGSSRTVGGRPASRARRIRGA